MTLVEDSITTTCPGNAFNLRLKRFETHPAPPSVTESVGGVFGSTVAVCCTSHAPSLTKPLARITELVVAATPLTRQPPGIRVPGPKPTQLVPLVPNSKEVRQTSGVEPVRNQVTVDPSKVRVWLAGVGLSNRPMRVRATPFRVVNRPPTRML